MLRNRTVFLWTLVAISGLTSGCSTMGIKNGVPYFSKQEQFEPPEEPDQWAVVGQMGRGNRKLEDENDPLKTMLMSKEAQDIERNLGYK